MLRSACTQETQAKAGESPNQVTWSVHVDSIFVRLFLTRSSCRFGPGNPVRNSEQKSKESHDANASRLARCFPPLSSHSVSSAVSFQALAAAHTEVFKRPILWASYSHQSHGWDFVPHPSIGVPRCWSLLCAQRAL